MLRWGLLGTARINRLVIPAIRASARSELVAVASRSEERGAAYAREWGIPRVTSYEGLIEAADIDVIYVPLPNSLHAAWTIHAVTAGKHVLCEKPLALSTAEVDEIAAAAAASGRVVTEGFMYRHHAQTARVCELARGGALGALRLIYGAFSFPQNREADVRLDPALGGGSLWDVGCYPVSYAQLLASAPPTRVSGVQQLGATGVDEWFAGTIEYENGIVCVLHCGFRTAYHTVLRLVGTEGVLHVERPFRPQPREVLRLARGGRTEDILVEGAPIFADEVADMEDAALGLRPPRISLAESRMHVATIQALHLAARDGRHASLRAR